MAFALPLFHDQYACGGDTEDLEVRTRPRRRNIPDVVGREEASGRHHHMLNDRSRSAPLFSSTKLAAVRFKVETEQKEKQSSQDRDLENAQPDSSVDPKRDYGTAKRSEDQVPDLHPPPETGVDEKKKPLERGRSILVLLKRLSSKEFPKEKLAAAKATNHSIPEDTAEKEEVS